MIPRGTSGVVVVSAATTIIGAMVLGKFGYRVPGFTK